MCEYCCKSHIYYWYSKLKIKATAILHLLPISTSIIFFRLCLQVRQYQKITFYLAPQELCQDRQKKPSLGYMEMKALFWIGTDALCINSSLKLIKSRFCCKTDQLKPYLTDQSLTDSLMICWSSSRHKHRPLNLNLQLSSNLYYYRVCNLIVNILYRMQTLFSQMIIFIVFILRLPRQSLYPGHMLLSQH